MNGIGGCPDGETPSVEVSAGGVDGMYGFDVTGWVMMLGAGDPSA